MKNKKGKEKIRENPSITTPVWSTPVHINTSVPQFPQYRRKSRIFPPQRIIVKRK